jgi:hypothetical protein
MKRHLTIYMPKSATLNLVADGSISTQYLACGSGGVYPYKPANLWLIGRNTGFASGGSLNIATLSTAEFNR